MASGKRTMNHVQVNLLGTPQEILPVNENRVGVILTPILGGSITFRFGSLPAVAGDGIMMFNSHQPLLLLREDVGEAIVSSLGAISGVAQNPYVITEIVSA